MFHLLIVLKLKLIIFFFGIGEPLTVIKWDDDKVKSFVEEYFSEEEMQSIEDNRKMLEKNTSITACCTPGHASGSVCCMFTKLKLCCSGFTMPIEKMTTLKTKTLA